MANMCNAVVLGAVRWHSPGVVTGDAPVPASCMESLLGCAQMLAQLWEPSEAIPDEKCHLWVTVGVRVRKL